MAKLVGQDSNSRGDVKEERWYINENFDLVIYKGSSRADIYVIDKFRKYDFINLIKLISESFSLFDNKAIHLIPRKNKCGISVPILTSKAFFDEIEKFLLNLDQGSS